MIGAGAVVTTDVPAHALVLGISEKIVDWICECEERLHRKMECKFCGRTYTETEKGLDDKNNKL